jgi:shikimate dehydrogenase
LKGPERVKHCHSVPEECLRHDLWVADIVYVPLDTALLKAAREAGSRTMGGGDMAVYQAVEAFRLFHGVMADSDRMRRHFAQVAKAE